LKYKQNKVWTLKCLESLAFECVCIAFLSVCCIYLWIYTFLTRRPSLLYIVSGVKETLENSQHACIKESFEACWSPMIFCLIWLLSYEGSISNPFLVWGNIYAARAVILVLLRSTTEVVEKVVVQFVLLSFFNALEGVSIQGFQNHFKTVVTVGTKGVSQVTYWVLTITRY